MQVATNETVPLPEIQKGLLDSVKGEACFEWDSSDKRIGGGGCVLGMKC